MDSGGKGLSIKNVSAKSKNSTHSSPYQSIYLTILLSCRLCKFAKKAMTLRRNQEAFTPSPHNGFSTRTRLRPGGPPPLHPNTTFDNPSNGSLPSFEEIGMRTFGHNHSQNQGQFLLNRRPYFSTMMKNNGQNIYQTPATPLVKQKTLGCSSPRVQMYRTRVVYSDARDAIKAAQEAAV